MPSRFRRCRPFLSLIAFSAVGLAAGHLLGGSDPNDRAVLALATAARHPGMAIATAWVNFPDERAVAAVVMCQLIVASIEVLPYVSLRLHARPAVA